MSKLKANKVREKLLAGQNVTGTAIYSSSPNIVEAAGFSGLDFIRIDTEHLWRRDDSLDNMIRAAIISDVVPIIRVDDDGELIRKALELGAGGIIVPHVNTADQASRIVRASKFPPFGTRGIGSLCLSAQWGTVDTPEWIAWSNREPVIGVMIEDVAAMDEVERIAAVEGLDFILFGPSDYTMSLGLERGAELSNPAVRKGLDRTISAAQSEGKHVMLGVGTEDSTIQSYVDAGVTMLELGHDIRIFQNTLKRCVSRWGRNA